MRVSSCFVVEALTRLARGVGHRRAVAAAARAGPPAPLLPEAVDQHRGDGQLVDQAVALLAVVDPLGELGVVLAERERLDREDPVARVDGIVERLPLVVAQLDAGHVALAPRGAFGRRVAALALAAAVGTLAAFRAALLAFGHVEQRAEARRAVGERALDADHVTQHETHHPLRLVGRRVGG
jgi:hypothetical protein